MSLIFFLLFLFQNLFVTLIMKYAYASYFQYENGMLMGVHIPHEHVKDPEVQTLVSQTKKRVTRFLNINCFLSVAICILNFRSMILFVLVLCLWLTGYLLTVQIMILSAHRRLYDLKMKNQWLIESQQRKVYIDTRLSASMDTPPLPATWHLLPIFIEIGCYLPLLFQTGAHHSLTLLIFFLCAVAVSVTLWILHIFINRSERTAYSQDSALNQSICHTMKHYKGCAFLLASAMNATAWIYTAMAFLITHKLQPSTFYVYITVQTLSATGLLIPLLMGQKRKQELLFSDTAPLVVDDDEYWKNGFYYNPSDHRMLVPDRMQSSNYTLNYARRGAWIFSGSITALLLGCFIWVASVLIPFLHVTIDIQLIDDTLQISSAGYSSSLSIDDLRHVELLEELPHDDFSRINGGETEDYLIGHFRGATYGKCDLYIFQSASPILLIQTKDETVFVNTKDTDEIQSLYEKLSGYISAPIAVLLCR